VTLRIKICYFSKRGSLSLVRIIEELLEKKVAAQV
jgi:hypothetical protein